MKAGVLVVGKAPVAGEAKTRLGATLGHRAAAELAGAALLDTLDACEAAFPAGHRAIALSGDLASGVRSSELIGRLATWQVLAQRGHGFGSRLAAAHADAAAALRGPVVQIGTDTPQVGSAQLLAIGERLVAGVSDAVLGPALDGGWWALGLTDPRWAAGLVDVPMSTNRTREATHRMLASSGATVTTVARLRDVDTPDDAAAVFLQAPQSRFAQAWRGLFPGLHPVAELLDAALAGAPCVVHGMPSGPFALPFSRWSGRCDATDSVLLDRCSGPTLDVGCGPGRLTHGLTMRGVVALGIDIAPRAVSQTRRRGAQSLRRDVFDALPAEGRWQSVLLADGNIGIGGDPLRLLLRVRELLAPQGRAVVEVSPPGTAAATHQVHLEVGGRLSFPFSWAVLGPEALAALAEQASLRMLSVTDHGGRYFAQLRKPGGSRCPI